MPHAKLIKSAIDKIPLVERGQIIYFDTEMPGFGLRVGKTKKTFFVQRDINAKTYCSTIGTYGIWTPDQARQEAREKLFLLSKGIDPDEERRQQRIKNITLRALMEEFFSARKKLRPATTKAYRSNLELYVTDWMDKPITDITEEKFSKRYAHIGSNNGETVANNVRRILSSMINFCIASHKLFDKNPVRIIAEMKASFPERRRDGHLKPHQLKPWYGAVNTLANRTYRDYLLLVLFTGLRRRETLSLRWSQIDFKDKSLTILETKNGDPLTLPLSDFVHDLLLQRKELTQDSLFVFPTCSGKGYLAEPKKGVEAVIAACGIPFMIHDLRRTFATIAASLDISTYSIKALMNHRVSDITGSYVIRDVERLRKPMQAIATYIQEQINRAED